MSAVVKFWAVYLYAQSSPRQGYFCPFVGRDKGGSLLRKSSHKSEDYGGH